jgi:membrane protein
MPDGSRPAFTSRFQGLGHLACHVLRRFLEDRCLIGASALSYTTIVSMVPLTAIALVVFSGFSQFGGARDRLLGLILDNFAPNIGDGAVTWFTSVAGNAAKTTAIGVVALIVTAILLLATVEEHLHFIFRVQKQRSWGQRVLAYWTVLTLGPILIGVLLSISGAIDSTIHALGLSPAAASRTARAWSDGLGHLLAPALELTVFTLLYRYIPNRHVMWRACLAGGALAALLLESLKLGFRIYIDHMSSYSTIYGALAGVPIALLWMYIFWAVVLLGAEVAVCLADELTGADPSGGPQV